MVPAMQARSPKEQRPGLTLVEALVVLALAGISLALVFPAIQSAREAVRRSKCALNLRQIALATASYADVWGALPAGVQFTFNYSTGSQHVAILPFLDQPTPSGSGKDRNGPEVGTARRSARRSSRSTPRAR
jgi:type II secretory pathway pseudopilin PulG